MKDKFKLIATCYDKKGNILSKGYNSYTKSHPLQKHFAQLVGHPSKIFLHAEISALLKSKGKQVHKIHIERFNKAGNTALAAPCPICIEAIKAFGVKEISYTI